MKNKSDGDKPYTKEEAHSHISKYYSGCGNKFINRLIGYWGGKNQTQVYFREALNNLIKQRQLFREAIDHLLKE